MITTANRALNFASGNGQSKVRTIWPPIRQWKDKWPSTPISPEEQAEIDRVVERNVALIYKELFNSEPPSKSKSANTGK